MCTTERGIDGCVVVRVSVCLDDLVGQERCVWCREYVVWCVYVCVWVCVCGGGGLQGDNEIVDGGGKEARGRV